MKIYFLRHGKADWPDWDRPDDERPLTKKGKREMRCMAKLLCELKVKPAALLSSPLPRAAQTAEIAAKALGLEVEEESALGKGFSLAKLRRLLHARKSGDLFIVGHEPDFSAVIRALTGGEVKLGKGGLARVDVKSASAARGRLIWLIAPKLGRLA
ncbi:MAG: SixA phosphatase family protein [Chthoniobacterales bacterium]